MTLSKVALSSIVMVALLALWRVPVATVPEFALQTPSGVPPELVSVTSPMLKWGLENGSLVAVLIIVIFFYRRDMRGELARRQSDNTVVVELVKTATACMARTELVSERMLRAVEAWEGRHK